MYEIHNIYITQWNTVNTKRNYGGKDKQFVHTLNCCLLVFFHPNYYPIKIAKGQIVSKLYCRSILLEFNKNNKDYCPLNIFCIQSFLHKNVYHPKYTVS